MTRAQLSITAAILLSSCGQKPSQDVLAQPGRTPSIARVTQCTQGNPDGIRCDVKTCKTDARSDCGIFRDRCKASGHDYDGDDSSGTCTRKEEIG